MKGITGIAISLALIFVLVQSVVFAATYSGTQIYIDNADDDSLWIKFYLDGGYMGGKMASQGTMKYFGFYRLSEGPHELKIEWKDPDTCEWEEKTETIEAAGEDITAAIGVVPNNISICEKAVPVGRVTDYGSLAISVQNNDDDALFVMLFINGERRRERTVVRYSTARFLTVSSLRPGSYNVSIRWKEPDTKKWYEKTQEITVGAGKNNITLETDEVIYAYEPTKPNSSIDVYIENIDDDDLWVDVLVDSLYVLKHVKSDDVRYFGRFDKLYPGKHTVKLRWIDPDVKGWKKKTFTVYLDRDGETAETFYTVKNTR